MNLFMELNQRVLDSSWCLGVLEHFVAGDGVSEDSSEKNIGREMGAQSDA